MKSRAVLAMVKEHWKLSAVFLLLPLLISCHTPPTTAQIKNDTNDGCGSGCTLLLTGAINATGAGINQGAHTFSCSTSLGGICNTGSIGSGAWTVKSQGTCVTTTNLAFNFPPQKWCISCNPNHVCNFGPEGPGESIHLQSAQ